MIDSFKALSNIDVAPLTKVKGKFNYLPWSVAVREVMKMFPTASWEFTSFDGLPYLKTEVGYFVECSVLIDGVKKVQMMPVLDFKNQTDMSPTAMSINKSQMRALAKAIALHGLGLDLWAGEDLNGEYEEDGTKAVKLTISAEQVDILVELLCDDKGRYTERGWKIANAFKFNNINEIKESDFNKIVKAAS